MASRNRPKARAKVAQMRALEARRRRRRRWLAGIGAAVVVIAAAVGITLAVTGSGPQHRGRRHAAAESRLAEHPGPAPAGAVAPGRPGPRACRSPAPLRWPAPATAATGQHVDGISCQTTEQTVFHIHAHLTIFVNGPARQVPAGIGIPGARAQNTAQGPFINSGTCFYWLHTHAADGIIHIESPGHRVYTLGDFFDEWGQPLGPAAGRPGERTRDRHLQRPALPGQPPRHPAERPRPDPARGRRPLVPRSDQLPRRTVSPSGERSRAARQGRPLW